MLGLIVRILTLIVFIDITFAEDKKPDLISCGFNDLKCLQLSTQKFLESTSKGIPEGNIKPIDPWKIAELDITTKYGSLKLKNVEITGLKNQVLNDFKLNVNDSNAEIKYTADVKVSYSENDQLNTIEGKTQMTSKYPFKIIVNDKNGKQHFDVGQENTSCENIGDVKYSSLDKADKSLLKKEVLCKIMTHAYIDVVNNIREAAKVMAKGSFFNNL